MSAQSSSNDTSARCFKRLLLTMPLPPSANPPAHRQPPAPAPKNDRRASDSAVKGKDRPPATHNRRISAPSLKGNGPSLNRRASYSTVKKDGPLPNRHASDSTVRDGPSSNRHTSDSTARDGLSSNRHSSDSTPKKDSLSESQKDRPSLAPNRRTSAPSMRDSRPLADRRTSTPKDDRPALNTRRSSSSVKNSRPPERRASVSSITKADSIKRTKLTSLAAIKQKRVDALFSPVHIHHLSDGTDSCPGNSDKEQPLSSKKTQNQTQSSDDSDSDVLFLSTRKSIKTEDSTGASFNDRILRSTVTTTEEIDLCSNSEDGNTLPSSNTSFKPETLEDSKDKTSPPTNTSKGTGHFSANADKISFQELIAHPCQLQDTTTQKDALPIENTPRRTSWHARHLILHPEANSSDPENPHLRNIFPETIGVGKAPLSHLIFAVKKMPPGPWPMTINGRLFTIHDMENGGRALIFPALPLGSMCIKICNDAKYESIGNFSQLTDALLRDLTAEVHAYFKEKLPKVHLVELLCTESGVLHVVLDDSVNIQECKKQLPGKIANCCAGYINEKDLHKPSWASRKATKEMHCIRPQRLQEMHVDETAFKVMRPGVMICSNAPQTETESGPRPFYATTSGILVEDCNTGHKYMTATSHGIGKKKGCDIWLSDSPPKTIGTSSADVPGTDICLVDLSPDITFINEPFDDAASINAPPAFSQLRSSTDTISSTNCYLNCPYTGTMESIVVARSVLVSDDKEDYLDNKYTAYTWTYSGQMEGNDAFVVPPEGTCGSVVWDATGIVQGFYQYCIKKGKYSGLSVSVSASELADAGFKLSKNRVGWSTGFL